MLSLFSSLSLSNSLYFDNLGDNAYNQVQINLRELAIAQLDLVLLHAPCYPRARSIEAWRGLERALADGLMRSIDVSNFVKADMEE